MLSRQKYLLLILAVALAGRLLLLRVAWRNDSAVIGIDSREYLTAAASLASRHTFETGGYPEIRRTPGYPALLALCGAAGPRGYGFAQIVGLLVDVLLVFLTYVLGARLVSPAAGLWAAALQALSAVAIASSVHILTDGVFSLLLTLVILLLARHFRDREWWPVALAAALTAAAIYVRPVGVIVVPAAAVVLLVGPRRLVNAGGFVVIVGALLAPWLVRNYVVAGYSGFSSISEWNLVFWEGAGVWAKSHGISRLQAQHELETIYSQRLLREHIEPGSPVAARVQAQMGREIILAHPVIFLRVHLVTSLVSLLPASWWLLQMLGITSGERGTLSVLQSEGLLVALKYYFAGNLSAMALMAPEVILLAIRYLAGMAYAMRQWRMWKLNWGPMGWLVVLMIAEFVLVGGPAAEPRFRLPVEPLLNIAGGAGVARLMGRRKGRSVIMIAARQAAPVPCEARLL
jgi:4-amino-4-deoxy-L-arabinose transferase-like glycosyltransferase